MKIRPIHIIEILAILWAMFCVVYATWHLILRN